MIQVAAILAISANVALCIISLMQIVARHRRHLAGMKEIRELHELCKERQVRLDARHKEIQGMYDEAKRIWANTRMNAKSIENVRLIFDQEGVIRCPHCFCSVIEEPK